MTISASPVVWIPHPVQDQAIEKLRSYADVVLGYGPDGQSFTAVADRVEAILLRTHHVDAAQISKCPRLKIIARHGVGVDTVDLETATQAGVIVTNTPGANTVAVAEHTIALLLAVRRNLAQASRANTAGHSDGLRSHMVGQELRGSTLGLIGFGRIAVEVARIAAMGFGMNVQAFDPGLSDDEIRARGATPTAFDSLLAGSDVVSVHVPLVPQTHHLLGLAEFEVMQADAVVINTSRGGIIDDDGLAEYLDAGHLGGAGLDVTEVEPLPAGHPLLARDDVVVTPHIAGQTKQSLERVAMEAAECILQALRGEIPASAVNRPDRPRIRTSLMQ